MANFIGKGFVGQQNLFRFINDQNTFCECIERRIYPLGNYRGRIKLTQCAQHEHQKDKKPDYRNKRNKPEDGLVKKS